MGWTPRLISMAAQVWRTSDRQCNQRVRRIGSPFPRGPFHALRCLLLTAAPAGRARRREGCIYSDRGHDQGFPSDPVWLVLNPETVPMMSDGSLLRAGGETWGPVSPDNVHETGVSLHRGRQGGAVRANAKKDLVKLAIRGFCALHGRREVTARLHRRRGSRRRRQRFARPFARYLVTRLHLSPSSARSLLVEALPEGKHRSLLARAPRPVVSHRTPRRWRC